jgi:hypothetical protein
LRLSSSFTVPRGGWFWLVLLARGLRYYCESADSASEVRAIGNRFVLVVGPRTGLVLQIKFKLCACTARPGAQNVSLLCPGDAPQFKNLIHYQIPFSYKTFDSALQKEYYRIAGALQIEIAVKAEYFGVS